MSERCVPFCFSNILCIAPEQPSQVISTLNSCFWKRHIASIRRTNKKPSLVTHCSCFLQVEVRHVKWQLTVAAMLSCSPADANFAKRRPFLRALDVPGSYDIGLTTTILSCNDRRYTKSRGPRHVSKFQLLSFDSKSGMYGRWLAQSRKLPLIADLTPFRPETT